MNTTYTENFETNQLIAERSFDAPKHKVWEHYTTELLDKWWAPEPYKIVTHSFDFSEGGHWHYAMRGPDGDEHFSILNYKTIDPENSFTAYDAFANEDWSVRTDMPSQDWDVTFTEHGDSTKMRVVVTCKNREDLETLINMGMKEGFDQGLDQLDALLKS